MSNINKTWFYIIDENYKSEINIANNIYVSLFVWNLKNDLIINIWENAKVDFYGFFYNLCPQNIIINQEQNNSSLNCKCLFINNNSDLVSNIKSQINSNNSTSKLNIISVVKENKIWINSSIKISKNSKKIESSLDLENIFIWDNWSINSIPNLFINSSDVKVSHSSKSHRIDESKLFYLKSRWLNNNDSIKMMTESYFIKNFSCLEMMNKELFDNNYKEFLNLN